MASTGKSIASFLTLTAAFNIINYFIASDDIDL